MSFFSLRLFAKDRERHPTEQFSQECVGSVSQFLQNLKGFLKYLFGKVVDMKSPLVLDGCDN